MADAAVSTPQRVRRSLGECVPGPRDAVAAVTLRIAGSSPRGSTVVPRAFAAEIASALAVEGGDGGLEPRTVLALLTEAGITFVGTDLAAPAARAGSACGSTATATATYVSGALDMKRGNVWVSEAAHELPERACGDPAAPTPTGSSVFDRYQLPAAFTSAPPALPAADRRVPAEGALEMVRVCRASAWIRIQDLVLSGLQLLDSVFLMLIPNFSRCREHSWSSRKM